MGHDRRLATGRFGEVEAEAALRRSGMRILERRWRCRAGEVDLIAEDGEVLVFVEVKTRRGRGFGEPWEAVDRRKQHRVARVAAAYVRSRECGRRERLCRFDVVEVLADEVGPPRIRHWEDAFRLWSSG